MGKGGSQPTLKKKVGFRGQGDKETTNQVETCRNTPKKQKKKPNKKKKTVATKKKKKKTPPPKNPHPKKPKPKEKKKKTTHPRGMKVTCSLREVVNEDDDFGKRKGKAVLRA